MTRLKAPTTLVFNLNNLLDGLKHQQYCLDRLGIEPAVYIEIALSKILMLDAAINDGIAYSKVDHCLSNSFDRIKTQLIEDLLNEPSNELYTVALVLVEQSLCLISSIVEEDLLLIHPTLKLSDVIDFKICGGYVLFVRITEP